MPKSRWFHRQSLSLSEETTTMWRGGEVLKLIKNFQQNLELSSRVGCILSLSLSPFLCRRKIVCSGKMLQNLRDGVELVEKKREVQLTHPRVCNRRRVGELTCHFCWVFLFYFWTLSSSRTAQATTAQHIYVYRQAKSNLWERMR